MMMIIAPSSRAHKGKKERVEVEGEYGGMMMIVAPSSRAHKGKKERGEVEGEYGGMIMIITPTLVHVRERRRGGR